MHPITAGLLAVAIWLPFSLSPCHAGQQEEIDALKQEVARLTERVEHHDAVNGMVREILAQMQRTLSTQVQLNTVQSDINRSVVSRLLQR